MATIASSGEDAIAKTLDIERDDAAQSLSPKQFNDYYEIERTVEEIVKGGFKRTALQFPDELLHDSVPIYRQLRARLSEEHELYVLADTSYGSCCVDEVAGQHVDADAMVHYGHACMSKNSRLPVVYVFGKRAVDTKDCAEKLVEVLSKEDRPVKNVLLRYEVGLTHMSGALLSSIGDILPSNYKIHHSPPPTFSNPEASTSTAPSPSMFADNTPLQEDCAIFYVGSESLTLTNLLMTQSSVPIYSYDPTMKSARVESIRANKLLMRRYAAVQKARDADVFGILVGTLGVASYLPMISHVRSLIARAKKKSYTISVGKLNPAKLGNFLEIECYVNVACPENSIIEAKEFLRPIITPFELELALQAESTWSGRYVLDFDQLLSAQPEESPSMTGDDTDPDRPSFSLVTGQYRQARRYGESEGATERPVEGEDSALVVRNQDGTLFKVTSAAGQFLSSRTYTGLEVRVGLDELGVLEQGRTGIARGYSDDHRDASDTPA